VRGIGSAGVSSYLSKEDVKDDTDGLGPGLACHSHLSFGGYARKL
jgi:hypothetical protein